MSSVLSLPFDQYQRYRLVADLLSDLRGEGRPLRVLDVGGRTALLRRFVPDRVTLVDTEPSEEKGLLLGNGCALPFADKSFDAVCAFDTLEHVPPSERERFVAECARVASRWVALAGPYDSPEVVAAEQLLQRFIADKLRASHRYLDEHRLYGLPSRSATTQQLEELGARVISIGHANLDRWLVLMCINFYLDYDPALRGLATAFHEFYNERLYAGDRSEPVYRHVVLAALDGAALPSEDVFGPPSAPSGTEQAFFKFLSELAAFDRERDAWREERGKLRQAIEELGADLEGHRETLEKTSALLEEHRATLAETRSDLEKHRSTLSQTRSSLEDLRADHERMVAELSGDNQALRADREVLQRELEATSAAAENIQSELRQVNAAAAEVNAALAERDQRLIERDRELARLERELRDRWLNLKRALRPPKRWLRGQR